MSCCCGLSLSTSAAAPKRSSVVARHLFCLGVAIILLSLLHPATAFVNLRGNSFSFSFLDAPARFAVPVDGSGICGSLHLADPIDGCSSLRNANSSNLAETISSEAAPVRFVLVVRGVCSFETKVRNAQDAGFQAAVVYDDREKSSLISMIGNSDGIKIHAVFISKMAGETLKKFSQGEEGECCIGPSADETAGNVLVISLCSLVIILSVMATFYFARNCQRLRRATRSRPQNISKQEVEVLPCITFRAGNQMDKHVSETCAICLEDYIDGETLRVLPCQHEFHLPCVDPWLMKWGTSCPVCKHDLSSRCK